MGVEVEGDVALGIIRLIMEGLKTFGRQEIEKNGKNFEM